MPLADIYNDPQVSAFLLDPGVYDILDEIARIHGLPVERSEEFLDLTEAIMDEAMPVSHMPALLAEAFGISEEAAQKVAADVAGQRLLPFEVFLPGLKEQIIAWGGKVEKYPTLRIAKSQAMKLGELKSVANSVGVDFTDVLLKRLSFLLQQYAKKEKTEESLKTFFARPSNIGGLGLNEEQTAALLAATLPLAAGLVVEEVPAPALEKKIEVATPTVASKVEMTVPEVDVAMTVPSNSPLTGGGREESKVRELEIAPSHEVAAEVPVAAGKVVAEPSVAVIASAPKPKVEKRRVESELDPNELKMPAKKAAAARKLTASVQDALSLAVALATENAASVLKKNKISEKVFADLTHKAIKGVRDIYQTRDVVERDWELKGRDLAQVMQAISLGIEKYHSSAQGSSAPATQNTSQSSEEAELDDRYVKLTTGKTGDEIEPVRAQLTVGSAALKTPDGQRKVVDVVSTARLAGPIEQLGKMTPTEFRRLSSSAAEAAQKIEDLLSSLETVSYEDRVKGVLAWRDSPMNQLYLQIAEEALSQGLALPEVSSRRRASGKESLSPAEMKALALLNTKIRF